ncbi:transcription and mRNA export factor ENY2 isoform X2 [Folsomia candida]|uniref:transcription and mRNA export factor ENY2 isoform X2 n=1 Tax=Folsomia candida TaxID=158441 RepID=UPI0016050661|nr:transcription and mRNA export factor ENY2 isoform X2 [Folsomia candida]
MEDYREQVKDIMEKIISDNPQLNKGSLENFRQELQNKMIARLNCPEFMKVVTDKVEARLEQCGWSDEIRMECNRLIRQRGIENISDTTELVRDLTPFARFSQCMQIRRKCPLSSKKN